MESKYIFVVDMDYADESDVVMFTVKIHCDVPERKQICDPGPQNHS